MTRGARTWLAALAAALLVACAGGAPPPDWQLNAHGALERALQAYLSGDARVEAAEFARARAELARTGRPELLARAELARCATRVASLAFQGCSAFNALAQDATPAERAYADYLAGRLDARDIALLPPQHRAPASAGGGGAALAAIEDPLARLVAAGVWLRDGRADPTTIAVAIDTASARGWRRPLMAWLQLQAQRAEQAGATEEAARIRRRIALLAGAA